MSLEVRFTPQAAKQVSRLTSVEALRIRSFLEGLNVENPRSRGRPLRGDSRLWRYRIGDYRLLADIDDDQSFVLIVAIGHRREVYRSFPV